MHSHLEVIQVGAFPAIVHQLLRHEFSGRSVIFAGWPVRDAAAHVDALAEAGASSFGLIQSSHDLDEVPTVFDGRTIKVELDALDHYSRVTSWWYSFDHPSRRLLQELDRLDPHHSAVIVPPGQHGWSRIGARRLFGGQRAEWLPLEDKTQIGAFFDFAGVRHVGGFVGSVGSAAAWCCDWSFQNGSLVWAGDNSRGPVGGGELVRRCASASDVADAVSYFIDKSRRIRVSPFVKGLPCSIHGLVADGGSAILQPMELITLGWRGGAAFTNSGSHSLTGLKKKYVNDLRQAAQAVAGALDREFRYRGFFTVDGIMTGNGFVATEVNPRYGTALRYARVGNASFETLHWVVRERETCDLNPQSLAVHARGVLRRRPWHEIKLRVGAITPRFRTVTVERVGSGLSVGNRCPVAEVTATVTDSGTVLFARLSEDVAIGVRSIRALAKDVLNTVLCHDGLFDGLLPQLEEDYVEVPACIWR